MMNRKNFWLGMAAALAFGLVGCGDSSSGSGSGGSGGGEGVLVTAVHLAPEVPSPDSTAVSIFIDGVQVPGTLSYGETTGRVKIEAGTYDVGIGLPGADGPLLALMDVELNDGDDITIVAYRTNEDPPVDVFVFNNSTEGLAANTGRVFVAHGANDPALNPVNIATSNAEGDTDCMTLIGNFQFEDTFPPQGEPNLDLPASTLNIGFDVDGDECPEVGPVAVLVTDGVVSILVAVDEDTSNEPDALDPELWGIVDADTLVRLIKTE